jgi:hypothetical protein
MMKTVALIFVVVTAGASFARAQDRLIVKERPAVVVPLPVPGIAVARRERPVEELPVAAAAIRRLYDGKDRKDRRRLRKSAATRPPPVIVRISWRRPI